MNKSMLIVMTILLSLATPALACQPGGKGPEACDHQGGQAG